jgi:hypothetical protein
MGEFDRFFQGSRGALAGSEAATNPMLPAGGFTGAGDRLSGGNTTHVCCRRQPDAGLCAYHAGTGGARYWPRSGDVSEQLSQYRDVVV